MGEGYRFRPIEARDDPAVAAIIRAVMPEFGASGEGFAINDPEVDWISVYFAQPRATYLVLEGEGRVLGGGGVARLKGGPEDVCELQKMYFVREARGQGWGEKLVRVLLERAQEHGYRLCYLETLTGMDAAVKLYERLGFQRLPAPMGTTGHCGCNRWYSRPLDPE